MAEQERAQPKAREEAEVEEIEIKEADVDTEVIDDLLDEIDAVLEENSEEFVKNYVQKGGE